MKKNGISLIVLIVTIIVIIILAAVVILTLSKNNPIESAKEATFKEDVRTIQDELAMYIAKDYTNKAGQRANKINADKYTTDGATDSVYTYIPSFSKKYEGKFVITNDELIYKEDNLTENELKWVSSLNINGEVNPVRKEWRTYIADEVDGVPIPKGFTHVAETTKATGLVIEDGSHNQFVWIPVDGTNIKYEKFTTFNGTTPTGDDALPTGVTDETADVTTYGGFYIGRYEATTHDGTTTTRNNTTDVPTCQKGKVVWTNINYTNAKASAELMYTVDTSSVQSGLLTGKAWDTTCKWIEDYKIKVNNVEETISLTDSSKYGNYYNSQAPANTRKYTQNQKQAAGANDNWKTKNIYDLAGNVGEWTSEARSSNRISRGGSYAGCGGDYPVSYRGYYVPSYAGDVVGFRLRLYIKTN